MKKKLLVIMIAVAMMISGTVGLTGCGKKTPEDTTPKEYTIQYTDNTGIHSLEVQSGNLYSINSIPEKSGYEFMGLYDAETGGTQYVNSGGSSVAAFTDNQNIVLYPQFKAKEYTLVLDYQGAAVTGSRSLTVGYNSLINDLPMNLTMENKNFVGWYTQPDKGGIQVADQYGAIPSKNIVDESIFDLSDPKGYIYLYAGFKGEEFTVTFYFTESGAPEEVQVEYGTNISDVQLETRVDGKAVITWSKKRNDTNKEEVFNGKVTSEMVLYAAEYAPVIDFDSNGGNSVNSIIARAGDAIIVPTPVRENYKFVGWQTTSGTTFSATTMPINSTKLTAKWQAMIMFNTNGGTDVNNISEPQGTRITLPETEKAGYMFAGWYDSNGEKYTATAMPSTSVKLYAKYFAIKTIVKNILSKDKGTSYDRLYVPSLTWYRLLSLEDLSLLSGIQLSIKGNVEISYSGTSANNTRRVAIDFYSSETISDSNLLSRHNFSIGSGKDYKVYNFVANWTYCKKIYCCFYMPDGYFNYNDAALRDFYIEIEYPDMSTLY